MSKQTKTILHVEDDRSLQKLVRVALERLGCYTVLTAADGNKAVELARATPPDFLLLDLDLPGMDGVATLEALWRLDGLRGTPVVFLTATGDEKINARLRRLGASAVLGKPFRPRELLRVIDEALARPRPQR